MKISIIGSRGYPSTYGGFETFVRVIAPYLVEHGHDVTVYARSAGCKYRQSNTGGVTVIETPGVDSKTLSTLSFGLTASADAAMRRSEAALVVNVANGYFIPLLRGARIPVLLNVDGLEWQRAKWGAAARAVFRGGAALSARLATRLVADSRAIRDVWVDTYGVKPLFIPYGAPLLGWRSTTRVEELGLQPAQYVLVVARFAPENNVELTLDAVEVMAPRPTLVIVGSGNYADPISARLRAVVDTTTVKWLGHVSDQELLADLWHHAGVYVHGHSVGGTNPALLQALGAGAPTLAYPSVFNREVVRHDELLYPPTGEGLAVAIARVLASADLRDRMRELGKERVRADYQWDDVCSRYTAELEALAGAA